MSLTFSTKDVRIMKKSIMSTALTLFGSIGVVATAALAIKATPKALKLIEDERSGYDENGICGEPLSKMETVRLCWTCYIPTIIAGAATVMCIFGANILNKRAQASIASAYALLDRSYREYAAKVKELYGDEADITAKKELALPNRPDATDALSNDDEKLFFDFATLQYFRAPMSEVVQKVELEDGLECYIITSPFDPSGQLL